MSIFNLSFVIHSCVNILLSPLGIEQLVFHLCLFTPTVLNFLPKIVQVLLNTTAAFGSYTAVATVQRGCHIDISL